jgi:hypothetical protein
MATEWEEKNRKNLVSLNTCVISLFQNTLEDKNYRAFTYDLEISRKDKISHPFNVLATLLNIPS